MKFKPLNFQGTLAAAGISLMPFNYLKSTVFKNLPYNYTSLPLLSSLERTISILLLLVMAIFIMINIVLTIIFLTQYIKSVVTTNEFRATLDNPMKNTTLFSPLISLPMSLIVIMGPLSFFIPSITTGLQNLILPASICFAILWAILIGLELKVQVKLFTEEIEFENLNFAWLLDVLAFGAVSLLGSSIAISATNKNLANIIFMITLITVFVGIILFALKFIILTKNQIGNKQAPAIPLLPAYFLVIPPLCLLGFSFYKILLYINVANGFDVSALAFITIMFVYMSAVTCLTFLVVLLFNYFKNDFVGSSFSPAQWGIV